MDSSTAGVGGKVLIEAVRMKVEIEVLGVERFSELE